MRWRVRTMCLRSWWRLSNTRNRRDMGWGIGGCRRSKRRKGLERRGRTRKQVAVRHERQPLVGVRRAYANCWWRDNRGRWVWESERNCRWWRWRLRLRRWDRCWERWRWVFHCSSSRARTVGRSNSVVRRCGRYDARSRQVRMLGCSRRG